MEKSNVVPIRNWQAKFTKSPNGAVAASYGNAVLALTHEPAWKDVVCYDAFSNRIKVLKPLPKASPEDAECGVGWWTDDHDDAVRLWLERHHGFALYPATANRAVTAVARRVVTHPVKEWLEKLHWDGVPRADTWLSDYAAVADTPHMRVMAAKWLISAVARIYQPGCQVDHTLVLEGAQRGGKTSLFLMLSPNPDWVLSTVVDLGSKDFYVTLRGKWLIILDELGSLAKGDIDRVKSVLTSRVDTYVPKYLREYVEQPRQNVFSATVNPNGLGWIKDETGGGRFWPAYSTSSEDARLDLSKLAAVRDQIWAEAVSRYKAGEVWHVTDGSVLKAIRGEQEARANVGTEDPWQSAVEDTLAGNKAYATDGIAIADLALALGISLERIDRGAQMRLATCLVRAGWRRKQVREGKGRKWVYLPPDSTEESGQVGAKP